MTVNEGGYLMNNYALITGASSGIGAELAKIFARNGHNLILVARNIEHLNALSNHLTKMYHIDVMVITSDLSDINSAKRLYDQIKSNNVCVDYLVNNAGYCVTGNYTDVDFYDIQGMLNTNIISLAALTSYCVRDMKSRGKGRIMNVGSTGSFAPCPTIAAYCASKAFVLSFSDAIAEELSGSEVTVTTLCPGPTKTSFAERANLTDVKLFKSGAMTADIVAAKGYNAMMKGKRVIVTGIQNKLLVLSTRFSPRKMVAKIGGFMLGK